MDAMQGYPRAKCPACGERRIWFGSEGKEPEGPCDGCLVSMRRVDVGHEVFVEAVRATGREVVALRTRSSRTVRDGEVPAQRHLYRLLVETVEGWMYYTASETLVADGWGRLGPRGCLLDRLREAGVGLRWVGRGEI